MKQKLIKAAIDAAAKAYCPYSSFRVGAAVLADGQIFAGCNIENASFGLTICAERVAIFKAVSSGAKRVSAIAVVCVDANGAGDISYRMPCGACRQVISEFADLDFVAFVEGAGDFSLNQLLPSPFKL